MKRKQSATLAAGISLFAGLFMSFLLIAYIPHLFILGIKFAGMIAIVANLIVCTLKTTRGTIQFQKTTKKPLRKAMLHYLFLHAMWWLSFFAVLHGLYQLMRLQAYIPPQATQNFIQQLFGPYGFYFSGLITVFLIGYQRLITRFPKSLAPITTFKTKQSITVKMISSAFYNIFKLNFLIVSLATLIFLVLDLSTIHHLDHDALQNPFLCAMITGIFLLLALNEKTKGLLQTFKKTRLELFFYFAYLFFMLAGLIVIAKVLYYFFPYRLDSMNSDGFDLSHSMLKISLVNQLLIFAITWLIGTLPFFASATMKIFEGYHIRFIVLFTLVIFAILSIFFGHHTSVLSHLLTTISVGWKILDAALLVGAAFYLLRHACKTLFWLGFLGHRPLKTRFKFETFALLTMLILGTHLLGANLIFSTLATAACLFGIIAILSLLLRLW